MAKSLFEQLGDTHHEDNGYFIPDLKLPNEEQSIGVFGQRHLDYLKQVQDITEQLKDENHFEWVRRVNHIRACVREIVNEKIIYA